MMPLPPVGEESRESERNSKGWARRGAPDWALIPGALSLHIGWETWRCCVVMDGSSKVDSGTSLYE